MYSMSALFQKLEREFCPPLDSSLLAALLAEIELDNAGNSHSPSPSQINHLRTTLRALSSQADEEQLLELSDLQVTSMTEDTTSDQDPAQSTTTGDTSVSSGSSSESSTLSSGSPLGFLQAALPDVPLSALKKALNEAHQHNKNADMWDVIASILSAQSISELEERGSEASSDSGVFREEDIEWEVVGQKPKRLSAPIPTKKRKQGRTTKIALIDIRQQNHAIPQPNSKNVAKKPPLPDPWIQVSSIATHIATYLSPRPPSFFQSFLHSPEYSSPYSALCAALESVCKFDSHEDSPEFSAIRSNLLDILLPEYEPLNSEERSQLVYETDLCVRAVGGRGDDALDLVKQLRELNSDFTTGKWELGVYHSPTPKSPTLQATSPMHNRRNSFAIIPPAPLGLKPPPLSAGLPKKNDTSGWQSIPVRNIPDGPHPLAQSIPAYACITANGRKIKGGGNGQGKGGKGDVGELAYNQQCIGEHRRKQEEYLKQAAKMWHRGDKKSRGGEIAFYYAEKAREFQQLAKQEALENARIMVHSRRRSTGKYDEIDLHGTTVLEALDIVREILRTSPCSPSQPLKIITGKGSHSIGKVAILKPAVKNALVRDGWSVGTWNAGLVVRGRNS